MTVSSTHYASGEDPRQGDLAEGSNGTRYLLKSWQNYDEYATSLAKTGPVSYWKPIGWDGNRMTPTPILPGYLRLVARARGACDILDRPALLDRLAHAEREWRRCRMWLLAVAIMNAATAAMSFFL